MCARAVRRALFQLGAVRGLTAIAREIGAGHAAWTRASQGRGAIAGFCRDPSASGRSAIARPAGAGRAIPIAIGKLFGQAMTTSAGLRVGILVERERISLGNHDGVGAKRGSGRRRRRNGGVGRRPGSTRLALVHVWGAREGR